MTGTGTPRPLQISDEQRAHFQKLLVDGVRRGLDADSPGSLLMTASMLVSVASGGSDPSATATSIRSLAAWNTPETSGLALAMATLIGDADLRRQLRRDITDRGHRLPRWLVELHRAEPVDRAVQLSSPFRIADELLVGVTVPGGHALTAAVWVDNELGSRAAEVAVYGTHLDVVLHHLEDELVEDATVVEVEPGDARARLTDALDKPPLPNLLGDDEPEWHRLRPLVTWLLTVLPGGGDAAVPGTCEDVDLDDVVAGFLASPWGRPWTRGGLPVLVENLFGQGLDNGLGDPLLWAPHHVRRLLDPRLSDLEYDDHPSMDRAPELLRDLIRYGRGGPGEAQQESHRRLEGK
jgi:hypothetical protein